MYDRTTESWWQQFTGKAVVGALTGQRLDRVASTVMPFGAFVDAHPNALVLEVPPGADRRYGESPYVGYDSREQPPLLRGGYQGPLPALAYVVVVGSEAWPLSRVRVEREITHGELRIEWHEGMASALDERAIRHGREIGYVVVTREQQGQRVVAPHLVTFAFAFRKFVPEGVLHQRPVQF